MGVDVVPQIKAKVWRGEQGLFVVVITEDRVVLYDFGLVLVSAVVECRRASKDREMSFEPKWADCCKNLLYSPGDFASNYVHLSDQPIYPLSMPYSFRGFAGNQKV